MPYADREAEAERIDKMYGEVDDEIAAMLAAAFATGLPAKVRAAAQQSKLMLTQAYEQTRVWNAEAIPELYGKTTGISAVTTPGITDASDSRFWAMTQTASRRIDDLVASFDSAHARREALAVFRKELYGLTTEELTREMERTLREGGITGFVDAAGKRWKLRTYAEMAARTTTMEAENAGVKDRVVASGHDLVNIVGPLDYPDGCPPAVLGGPYSITGATKDVMTLDQAIANYGVFHPRCRHSISPVAW